MAENRELNDAWDNWEKMDDTGYGREGSNKPKDTQKVQEAYRKLYSGESPVAEPLPEVQPSLIPMTGAEQREAARKSMEDRLQPNGRYIRPRRIFVRSHPSDFSAGMRGINREGLRRARSKQ